VNFKSWQRKAELRKYIDNGGRKAFRGTFGDRKQGKICSLKGGKIMESVVICNLVSDFTNMSLWGASY